MADSKEDELHPQTGQKGKGRSSEPPGLQLPPGWERRVTEDGQTYYVDHYTRSTSWILPTSANRQVPSLEKPEPMLPQGWERRVTKGGRTFYMDHNTRTTSWTLPLNEKGQVSSLELRSDFVPTGGEERVNINGETLYLDHNTCTTSWSISAGTNDDLQQPEDQRTSGSRTTSSTVIPTPSVSSKSSEDALWESFGALFDSESKHFEEVLSPKGFEELLRFEETRLGSALSSTAEPTKIPTLSTVQDELSRMPSHVVRLHLFDHARTRYIINKIYQNQAIVDAAMKPIAHILGFPAGMIFKNAKEAAQNLSILERLFIVRLHYDLRNSKRATIPATLRSLAAELFDSTVTHLGAGDITSDDSRRYLDMAIETARRSTMLLPEKSPEWASMVYYTAVMHRTKFSQFASEADLHLALRLAISALEVLPRGHQQYTRCLDHVIFLYAQLYEHGGGDSIYLAEALRLARFEVTLEATGADIDARVGKMSRLADLLLKDFQRERNTKTLDEALEILNLANGFGSEDLHVRADLSFNLGRVYMMRFDTCENEADLIEGLKNHHRAIRIIPQGHPSCGRFYLGLVSAYKTRYDMFFSWDDLVTASSLAQKTFSMVDVNETLLAMVCVELGVCLQKAFERTEENIYWENSVRMFEVARSFPEAPVMVRLCSSIFAGYLFIAKRRWVEAFRAFLSAVDFLERLATSTITRDDQQKILQQFGGVSAMAAAVALEAGVEPWVALQTLERGRGVILNISLNRRSDISEIKENRPGLYDEYMLLRNTLYSKLLPDDTPEGYEHRPATMLLRAREQQRKIQQLEESIQHELGPKVFHRLVNSGDFQRLAIPGPIIAFNTTKIRSDAFIITDKEVNFIRLQELELEKLEEYMTLLIGPEAVIDGSAATREARNTKFESFLEWLWTHAVLPVLQELNLISPNPPSELPRIWWVANGLLGLTPLHAAGLRGKLNHSTSSHVISSFVPTLRALSRAREKSSNLQCFSERALIVTMPQTKGLGDLKTSEDEISIKSYLPPTVEPEPLESPSKAQLLEKLEKSSAVFFSCHGEVDPEDPANSGLLLREGSDCKPERLTFRDLSNCETKLGKLACLLACSTATSSNEQLVEEMLHVVSGFQLAGFPHVIGSLWPVGDKTTNDIVKAFMQHLSNGRQDDAAIARALHYAVNTQRINRRRLSRNVIAWAPFIHFGC